MIDNVVLCCRFFMLYDLCKAIVCVLIAHFPT